LIKAWHFIIGANIIKKINIIVILILVVSCASINKRERFKDKKQSGIIIQTQQWNTGSDSINLNMNISLPLNRFVFTKQKDHFKSEVTFTLVISNKEENTQLYRETWKEVITKLYYEYTRDPENYYKTEKNFSFLPGEYKLFLNVQDEDSRKNWKVEKEIELERVNHLSPSLLFIKDKVGELVQVGTVNEQIDTIWLRTQVNIPEGSKSEITYLVNLDESVIDSGNIVIKDTGIKNLYYLPIPFIKDKRGKYEIELKFLGDVQKITFLYGIKTKNYWTDDIDEMVSVMRYILTYSEFRKLKEKNDSERWEAIDTYWKEKDPSPKTPENELLEELNERVKFSNKNFSILMDGWKSDRGRTYIIYGEPHLMDDYYHDNMGYQYQKWVYS
ncbi:uncharacterized protein METZ01_LOCUS298567, partial [marine metagenome]